MKFNFKIKEISRFAATTLVQSYHYSKVMPQLTKYFLGCFLDDELVGVLTLGWGTKPRHTFGKIFPKVGILEKNKSEIANLIGEKATVIEPGAGESKKISNLSTNQKKLLSV